MSLSSALDGCSPVVLKLDVEGYEHEVLQGATSVLMNPSVLAILTEQRSKAVTSILGDAGFTEVFYDAFTGVAPSAVEIQRRLG